jgi:hypothetical protein
MNHAESGSRRSEQSRASQDAPPLHTLDPLRAQLEEQRSHSTELSGRHESPNDPVRKIIRRGRKPIRELPADQQEKAKETFHKAALKREAEKKAKRMKLKKRDHLWQKLFGDTQAPSDLPQSKMPRKEKEMAQPEGPSRKHYTFTEEGRKRLSEVGETNVRERKGIYAMSEEKLSEARKKGGQATREKHLGIIGRLREKRANRQQKGREQKNKVTPEATHKAIDTALGVERLAWMRPKKPDAPAPSHLGSGFRGGENQGLDSG